MYKMGIIKAKKCKKAIDGMKITIYNENSFRTRSIICLLIETVTGLMNCKIDQE